MNFTIKLKTPEKSRKVFALVWMAFLALFLVIGLTQNNWIFMGIGMVGTFVLGAWQLKLLQNLYKEIDEVIFYEGQWFVMERNLKIAIEIKPDTVTWPLWVTLKFRELDPSKPSSVRQLILFRDAMTDAEFRHLSRTLKFYKAK